MMKASSIQSITSTNTVQFQENVNKHAPTYLCTLLQNECESPLVDHTYPNMDAAYKPSINHGYLLQHKNLAYTVASAPDRHSFNNQRIRLFSGQREWQMASYYFVCLQSFQGSVSQDFQSLFFLSIKQVTDPNFLGYNF